MGSVTDAVEVDILCLITGQATTIFTSTPLAAVYCRLTSTVPTDSTAGTEISNVDYTGINTKSKWAAPVSGAGTVANSVAIDFTAAATVAWATIVGFELWTAVSGGTRLAWGTLTVNKTPQIGDPVSFPIGALVGTCA